MSCYDQDYTILPTGTLNFGNSTFSANSSGTVEYDLSIKNPIDPWIEELKKTKNKKDNTYILIMARTPKSSNPNKGWDNYESELDWETVVFDNFNACNVAEQIIKKDNEKGLLGPRTYFYHNKKFFEMTEVN